MEKKIHYKQTVNIKEYYEIDYTLNNFKYDCNRYKIENVSFDELCDVLSGVKPDFMISVTEYHVNCEGICLYGPHYVSILDFFSKILVDDAFERDYGWRDELEITDKEIVILND